MISIFFISLQFLNFYKNFIFENFFHEIRYILPDFHGKLENITADQLLTEKRKLKAEEFSSGNIEITPAMTYNLQYTAPDGYEYLGFLGAESYNVPTSISYQGNTGNAISLYVNCFGNGGNGSINMRLLFQRK